MWIVRLRQTKNKKGITLVEVIVAMAVTAVLAVALSIMVVPIMNTYTINKTRATLSAAVVTRLDDIADELRGATGVYLASGAKSFPDLTNQRGGVEMYGAIYGIALAKTNVSNLYPELKIANLTENRLEWACDADKYNPAYSQSDKRNAHCDYILSSDDYQLDGITCVSEDDFYFYVRNTGDNPNDKKSTSLEIYLKLTLGDVSYSATKCIVCDCLMMMDDVIHTANLTKNPLDDAEPIDGKAQKNWKKYHSVWYSKRE